MHCTYGFVHLFNLLAPPTIFNDAYHLRGFGVYDMVNGCNNWQLYPGGRMLILQ